MNKPFTNPRYKFITREYPDPKVDFVESQKMKAKGWSVLWSFSDVSGVFVVYYQERGMQLFDVLITIWDPTQGATHSKEAPANSSPCTEEEADELVYELQKYVEPTYRGQGLALHSVRKQKIVEGE